MLMASNKSSVILMNDEQDVQPELQFQDFSLGESTSGVATLSPSDTFTTFPSPDSNNAESEDLLGSEKRESSFWKFSYYQSFFDIETVEFLQRLKWSFVPVLGRATFLDRQIRPKPDLYGPFWIAFCLVYSTAIMSNVANYFNGAHQEKRDWTFNFHRVSLAATAIYAYVFLLPLILWGLLRHFQYSNRYSLLEIICVYGYSLSIFLPISIFWIFDAAWLHWILVIIGTGLTGAVLLQIFWPIFRDDNKKTGTILLCTILICHLLLGIGFGTLFFQRRVEWTPIPNTAAPVLTTVNANVLPPEASSLKQSRSIITEENLHNTLKDLEQKQGETPLKNSTQKTENSISKEEHQKQSIANLANASESQVLHATSADKLKNVVNPKI